MSYLFSSLEPLPLSIPVADRDRDREFHRNKKVTSGGMPYGGCVNQYEKRGTFYWRFSWHDSSGRIRHRHIKGGAVGGPSDLTAGMVRNLIRAKCPIDDILLVI